ncbi:hypothetical protein Tco_0198768 [Tanacetum coccineum]
MSETQDEIPPPPPPPATQQTPTQQTPHTVSTIKLPILKKGEYDIWAMKMEHYLAHTDYPIWEVIQNGNGPVSVTTDTTTNPSQISKVVQMVLTGGRVLARVLTVIVTRKSICMKCWSRTSVFRSHRIKAHQSQHEWFQLFVWHVCCKSRMLSSWVHSQ